MLINSSTWSFGKTRVSIPLLAKASFVFKFMKLAISFYILKLIDRSAKRDFSAIKSSWAAIYSLRDLKIASLFWMPIWEASEFRCFYTEAYRSSLTFSKVYRFSCS